MNKDKTNLEHSDREDARAVLIKFDEQQVWVIANL